MLAGLSKVLAGPRKVFTCAMNLIVFVWNVLAGVVKG